MLAECILNCGRTKVGYGLAKLTERYLNITLSKETRNQFSRMSGQNFTLEQIQYGALDVKYLHNIMNQQMIKIKSYDFFTLFALDILSAFLA